MNVNFKAKCSRQSMKVSKNDLLNSNEKKKKYGNKSGTINTARIS